MLSIIIPTYNEAKIIRKTIEFLQGNLVGKNAEIIVSMVVVPMRQWR
jgi:glycosyltransferase involved in cell wall biosynthesis